MKELLALCTLLYVAQFAPRAHASRSSAARPSTTCGTRSPSTAPVSAPFPRPHSARKDLPDPSRSNQFEVGQASLGIIITRLRASDGLNLGVFPLPFPPIGVIYEGTSLWVAGGDHSIAKLRASDGSLLGTFNVGTYTGWPSTAPTFWVVNTGSDDKQAKAECAKLR